MMQAARPTACPSSTASFDRDWVATDGRITLPGINRTLPMDAGRAADAGRRNQGHLGQAFAFDEDGLISRLTIAV